MAAKTAPRARRQRYPGGVRPGADDRDAVADVQLMSTILFIALVATVGACRLIELRLSKRHQRALAERGAPVVAEPMFRAMVALHTGILVAAVIEVLALDRPALATVAIPALVAVGLANALRF